MANKILVARGTKARIETIKETLAVNELVYSTDTGELGVKKADGNIEYFSGRTQIDSIVGDIDGALDSILENGGGGGGIPEAPIDDKLYGRKNGTWSEVISGGGGIDMNDLPYMTQVSSVLASVGRYDELETAWNNQENFTVSASGDMTGYTEQDPHVLDIVIPRNVKSIPNYTIDSKPFKKNNYTSITLPNGVTSIGDYAFSEWSSNNQPLVIPNSVTNIGRYAFSSWYNNNQPLVIPNSVTSIDNNAFREWYYNNQPLVIPNSVTSIGEYAFYRWASNKHPLVIPDSVTSIGRVAFGSWDSTPYAEIHATTPPTLEYGGLDGSYPIYVPDASVDDYKTATNWVTLSSRIFSINDKP